MNEPDTDSDAERFAGMTVNERLFTAGTLDRFDTAARRRDRATMLRLLREVALTDSEANETTNAIIANPSFYGF